MQKLKAALIFTLLLMGTSCQKYTDLTSVIMGTYQSNTGQVFIGSTSRSTVSVSYDHDLYFINKATMSDASNFTFDEIDSVNGTAFHYIGGGQLLNNSLQLNMSVTGSPNGVFSVTVVNFDGVRIP